jgi:hypothetical protein
LTLDDLDRRTLAAQRALAMHERLVAERGGAENLSILRYEMTKSVAVLSAMVEDLQVRWLKGEPIDSAAIGTLLNARRREAEVIGIDPAPRDVTPDLREYLAQKSSPEASPVRSADGPAIPVAADPENESTDSPRP